MGDMSFCSSGSKTKRKPPFIQVPIVEPEVLMDGTHSIEHSAVITEKVLAATYKVRTQELAISRGTL